MAREKKEINTKFLDALRGIAALYVMIGHARWLLWEGYSEGFVKHPEQYSLLGKAGVYFFMLFRYGHAAVIFFFVLSGFVIHLRYSKLLSKNPILLFDFKAYFLRRIRRIYPPFLMAIMFTLILDKIGIMMGGLIYNHQTPNPLLNVNVNFNHSLWNLLGNLFFIESTTIGIWGSDSPLWSLKYEWWFYMLYPIIFYMNRKSTQLTIVSVIGLSIVSSYLYAKSPNFTYAVFSYLFLWWLGGILSDIYTQRIKLKFAYTSIFIFCLPVALILEKRLTHIFFMDTLWGIGFLGLISFAFFLIEKKGWEFKGLNKIQWLGDCSYTLYIIHFPILVLMNGLLLHYYEGKMPISQLYVVVSVITITILAYFMHFFIEKPLWINKSNSQGMNNK